MTTASTRFGTPCEYSTVTWLLPSGRSHGSVPFCRTSATRRVRRGVAEYRNPIAGLVTLDAGLARHARGRRLGERPIQDGVRDLVAHLVRVAFSDTLTGKQQACVRLKRRAQGCSPSAVAELLIE